jgi:hypothetical protein
VSFTAYKTTDKAAVRGVFKKITLTNTGERALDCKWCSISIPVNSLFTNDATGSRDPRF